MTAPTLPELPNPLLRFEIGLTPQGKRLDFTADDMRSYALASIAADRALTTPDRAANSLAAPEPVKTQDVIAAIRAVDREAARRGEMFPQTSDEQREDRHAATRVMEMIGWYEKNTGCARIKGWPLATPTVGAGATQAKLERLYDATEQVLLHYRLSNLVEDDGEGTSNYPLVDHLCTPGSKDIGGGEHEIRLICDAIYCDEEVLAAVGAGAAELPELVGVIGMTRSAKGFSAVQRLGSEVEWSTYGDASTHGPIMFKALAVGTLLYAAPLGTPAAPPSNSNPSP